MMFPSVEALKRYFATIPLSQRRGPFWIRTNRSRGGQPIFEQYRNPGTGEGAKRAAARYAARGLTA